ncbi:MAG: hypothetical protein ABSH44_10825 [Bryobacteraceae bacterium]|jgi:hypothetical protein
MAHVISSLTAQGRPPIPAPAHLAAVKPRQHAAETDTSPAATSFRALLPGKAASAASPAVAPALAAAATAPAVSPAAPALAAAAGTPAQNPAPTAESVFGSNPWIVNPTGTAPDGSSYSFNPLYFATAATAAQVAQMVGGKVVASNQLVSAASPFVQQQPNQMVQLANGTLINAGLVASFYTHGYPQSYIDQLIANEIGSTT